MPAGKVFRGVFKDTLIDEMKVWKDFTGWKNASLMTKGGKALGFIGTGITVFDNVVDNFYKDGEWDFSNGANVKEFVVDTTVDISTGAGAMAFGAAVGSLILPPVGTVVGIGLGAATNYFINVKFGEPPASIVDHTKEFANNVVDSVGDAISNVGKSLSKLIW